MSMKAKIVRAFICSSFLLLGISLHSHPRAQAQSGTNGLDQYTTNRLNGINYQNSARRFSSNRFLNQATRRSIPRYSQYSNRDIKQQIFGSTAASRPKNKPFSSVNRGPAITPYLGLSGLPTGGAPNYYSNVKPRLEQQRINQRNQRQTQSMQSQLNKVAAQGPYSIKGSENMAPTGHAAVYMNLGGFYPSK